MKQSIGMIALLLLAMPLLAHASCDEVKAGIDAKLRDKGITGYTLDVVPEDQADVAGKVVGQCEGDKKIIYAREAAGPAASERVKPAHAKPDNARLDGGKSAQVGAEPGAPGG